MNLVNLKDFLSFFLVLAIAISGCGSPGILISPIVTGVIYWVNGDSHKYYEKESEIVYRATKHALQELNLPITQDSFEKIVAGDENRFSIKIEKADKNITKLSIRINFLGDKDFAELIYKKVDSKIDTIEFDPNGNPSKFHNRRNF